MLACNYCGRFQETEEAARRHWESVHPLLVYRSPRRLEEVDEEMLLMAAEAAEAASMILDDSSVCEGACAIDGDGIPDDSLDVVMAAMQSQAPSESSVCEGACAMDGNGIPDDSLDVVMAAMQSQASSSGSRDASLHVSNLYNDLL